MHTLPVPVDILAFGPHPDDIEIGAGGLLLRCVSQGYRVGLVDLTGGELGTKGTPADRANEGLAAAELLGAEFRVTLGLPDGHVTDDDASRRQVVEIIRQARPAVMLSTQPGDRHPDHRAGAALVSAARFLARLPKYVTGSPFHPCQQLWYYLIHDQAPPVFLVDITAQWERKQQILLAHTTQIANPVVPEGYKYAGLTGYLAGCDASSRYWGMQAGIDRAEAFLTATPICLGDPLSALGLATPATR